MRGSRVVKSFVLLFALSLLNCTTIKNKEVCTVAGILSAGMDCANTLNDDERSMDLDQTIEFLEPQEKTKDRSARAGAMCLSADHFTDMKSEVEILCRKLGNRCDYEKTVARMEALSAKTIKKIPKKNK